MHRQTEVVLSQATCGCNPKLTTQSAHRAGSPIRRKTALQHGTKNYMKQKPYIERNSRESKFRLCGE